MKLKKKTIVLSTFFLMKSFNPFFYELVIESIKNFKCGSLLKKKKPLNLRISNKTLTLFFIYLNIFSTQKLNTQKNIKGGVNIQSIKNNFLSSITKNKLMREIEVRFNELNIHLNKSLFFDLYLNRCNEDNTLEVLKSIQIITNLNNI